MTSLLDSPEGPASEPDAPSAEQSVERVAPPRRTLKPPDWSAPRSVSALAIEWLSVHAPVARRRGQSAELASLRAGLEDASVRGDLDAERALSAELARALASRGAELDVATRLARRALLLGDDPALREELSSWFAALGEPGLAAATLGPLVDTEHGERLGALLVRVAVFLGRHGDAAGAAEALSMAAHECSGDPVPEELLAAVAAWNPEAVSNEDAAAAYLEAARRREARGDRAGAFEDLLRAFEIAPEHALAAQRLASELSVRGRPGAADQVLREHAFSCGPRGVSTHRARLRDAFAEGDAVRALGAAFDVGLYLSFDPGAIARSVRDEDTDLVSFDRLLADAGLHEILAARLELAADTLSGWERALARVAQGRVCLGAIGSTERAIDAWIDAVVSDPSNQEAKSLLREHAASTGDHAPLVEALVRAGGDEASKGGDERVACLRELFVLADQRLSEPTLALFAVQKLLSTENDDEELRAAADRLAPRAAQKDALLASVREEIESADGTRRLELDRLLAAALRVRPDALSEYIAVLEEIVRRAPDDRASRQMLDRALARAGRRRTGTEAGAEAEALEQAYRHDVETSPLRAERERARLALSALARARGDRDAALEWLAPLVDDAGTHRAGWAMSFALSALAGQASTCARALCRIAEVVTPELGALLSCVSSDLFVESRELANARRAAEQACHADSASVRSAMALARATFGERDRVAAVALERAVAVVLPRAVFCRELAETYNALGEHANALAWTQRALALRPGDRMLASLLLERVTAAAEPARLGDSLAWLLSQPEPLGELSSLISNALCRLAELDPMRGAALARRVLDVFGPRVDELAQAVLAVADSVGERGLAIAVFERRLASGAPGADRTEILLDLARRRRHAGDADGAARSLVRALAEGGNPSEILGEVELALPPRSSDGEISLLEGRAEALSSLSAADLEGTAKAWRELGAALWDLAGDREGAIAAWERSAALSSENGIERLARDLVAFAGHQEAVARLDGLAAKKRNRSDVARLLAAAAAVALDGGLDSEALPIAIRALEADSSRADVLGIAERAATDEDVEELERAYEIVAEGALGMYGERAAHYRAARQLERRGLRERGLRHAVAAFEAVPAEGVTFVLMMRLAERVGDATDAVHAIERVASLSKNVEERATWLRRAALVAGSGDEGKRQRVDVLLRALEATPHGETLRVLGAALMDLIRELPEDAEIAELRFSRALRSMLPRLEGPDGARTGVEGAAIALRLFGTTEIALAALTRAAEADASIDEFASIADASMLLASEPGSAKSFVEAVVALASSPHANIGMPLVNLADAVSLCLGDTMASARLLAAAARRDLDDAELLARAEASARAAGDRTLLESVLSAVPVEVRAATLLERASELDETKSAEAIKLLEEARRLERLPRPFERKVALELRVVYRVADRFEDLEALLREDLDRAPDFDERVALGRELTAFLVEQDRARESLEVTDALLADAPTDRSLLTDLLNEAVAAGAPRKQIEALSRLSELETEPSRRVSLLRKLADVLESEGADADAMARHRQILAVDPGDAEALSALERDAVRNERWDTLADLLKRRALYLTHVEDSREVRLRLVQVLESRLGRTEDARVELEAILTLGGEHLGALTHLADLNERLGAKQRAAPLWLRASAIPRERGEAAEFSRRACQAYLDGGDVESARRVFAQMTEYPRTPKLVALRVDIERRGERPIALSEALEEMALSSMDPPNARAALLVEAARAAMSGGHPEVALGQAQRASRIARESAAPQLFARQLEYRRRGAGTREEATNTVVELRAIREVLGPLERELSAFLLAEALDVSAGEGEGMRELTRAHAEVGSMPLIALGMAERLARSPTPERALPLFDAVLEGDPRDLRPRGDVALAAAEAARRAGLPDAALGYLEAAAAMPESRARALAAQATLRRALGRSSEPPASVSTLDSSPASSSPVSSREHEMDDVEARAALRAENPEEPLNEARMLSDAPIALTVRRAKRAPETSPAAVLPPPVAFAPTEPQADERTSVAGSLRASAPPKPKRTSESQPASKPLAPEPSAASVAVRPNRTPSNRPPTFQPENATEEALLSALSRGSIDAGRELVLLLENRSDRAHDLVNVCRRVAYLLPGDRAVLEKLCTATLADRNVVYARAVEHVLRAFDPRATPLDPPPLSEQVEQPDRTLSLLFRDTLCPATEALGLVWHGAPHLFRRDPASYGVTGLERVAPGMTTALSRQFGAASRLLGMARTPLFQRRSGEGVTINVALLSAPALLLTGEVKTESSALGYHLGAMLSATMAEHVLIYGAPEAQVENVLRALVVAFGPPQSGNGHLAGVATLAEMLWESIPARSQRRLRELCDEPSRIDYSMAKAAARRAARRAGLFIAGDLTVAVREACADVGISTWGLDQPGGLAALCSSSPAIADLVRLATSQEYASARWQQLRGARA